MDNLNDAMEAQFEEGDVRSPLSLPRPHPNPHRTIKLILPP